MNIFKTKRISYIFITLATVGMLLTSCEKEIIQADFIEANSNIADEQTKENTKTIELRNPCANFEQEADVALKNLATNIKSFANNSNNNTLDAVVAQYDYYRLNIVEPCLPAELQVPVLTFENAGSNCPFNGGSCSGSQSNGTSLPTNTIEWFLCRLANYLQFPNNTGYKNDAEYAFNYYIDTANNCLGINLTAALHF